MTHQAPPQPAGLAAFHRAGQTFLRWKEVEPLLSEPVATWGQIRKALAEAKDPIRYRVYAHDRPIDAGNVAQAELVAEVGPLSGYNVNARNKEYLIAQAMVQPDEIGELARDYNGYMHQWTMDHPRMDRYPCGRFVVDESAGPLPPGAGLYVHQPAKAGKRHYAVVSCRGDAANLRDFSPANSLAQAVDETVGPGVPIRQGKGLHGPYFDWPGTRWTYVQWCSPPLGPRGGMSFNWSVLIPPGISGKAPCELYFHRAGYSYAQPSQKMLLGSVQIAPHDWPASGWYGYHESWPQARSAAGGKVANHTQRRIMAFLDWAAKALPIDPERVMAVGGDGAAAIAIEYPQAFACVYITGFDATALNPKAADELRAAWGPATPDIADRRGRGNWGWAMLDELVAAAPPGRDLPFLICRGASWGRDEGWGKGWGRLYRALEAARQPFMGHWAWGGKLEQPDKYDGLWRGMDFTRTMPVPAISNSSLDREGEGGGQANHAWSWKDARDAPDAFETTIVGRESGTFDLTPRRLGRFKVAAGEKLQWEAAPAFSRPRGKEKVEAQSGQVAADEHGLVTIKGLSYPREADGLVVRIIRGQ